MIENANFTSQVDFAFAFILGIAIFFLIAITAVMIYFVVRYRRSKNPQSTHIDGNNTLEVIWTVIPTILVMMMFYYGWAGWYPTTQAPKDAFQIKTMGQMWRFWFEYPNGKETDTLYVPKDRAINLDLIAKDVIHSVYVPAYRLKMDMVPGYKTNMWFIPQTEGQFDFYCAEYCGLNHSYMVTAVKVLPQDEFDKWYNDTSQLAANNNATDSRVSGAAIAKRLGCVACHSKDGVSLVGPSFKDLFGTERTTLINGVETKVIADDNYIKESIIDPNKAITKGYSKGLMLSYKDQLKDGEVELLVEYLKTLSK